MTTESDCLDMGLCANRPGLASSSKSTSSRKSAVDSADDNSEKHGVGTGSESDKSTRKRYFPDPKVGLESSKFSEKQENAAMKLERDLIRSDEKWYWKQMNLAMGPKYGECLGAEIHRVSPATRMALLRNMQNYPVSQIEEEGYDSGTHGNKIFSVIAAQDPRAIFYLEHPEELCSKRESNSQIWFTNAPPVEARPPPGNKDWDEGIFDREKAIRPVPEEFLFSGAGDPLDTEELEGKEPEKEHTEPCMGEGLACLCGIVGSLKRKKKPDSV
ncbi:hypothetical protein AC578_3862 [Pseudocercospora eumusae]|uniref:Uncharacterized protein n=1 Tax=Pseudocercospora eumusae TaxID=321146 RepID=A0A139GWY0_9PEZI|nr:hypothetical protein AC578_3862 [Pseudocercospora eumusae]